MRMKKFKMNKKDKIKYQEKLKNSYKYFIAVTENKLSEKIQDMVEHYINNLSKDELKNDYDYLLENDDE